jgi:hypothetical protein
MPCKKCGNEKTPSYYYVCDECFSQEENLPTNVRSSDWITVINRKDRQREKPVGNSKLRSLILTGFNRRTIVPDPFRKVVVVGDGLEIPMKENDIDNAAKESGLVDGKWLIHAPYEKINEIWKTVASSTMNGELGVDTKVSTVLQGASEYVICVYTKNYLYVEDVKRVRKRLTELGFPQRLYYKPDIYTYLKIYHKTFPGIRASRYAE